MFDVFRATVKAAANTSRMDMGQPRASPNQRRTRTCDETEIHLAHGETGRCLRQGSGSLFVKEVGIILPDNLGHPPLVTKIQALPGPRAVHVQEPPLFFLVSAPKVRAVDDDRIELEAFAFLLAQQAESRPGRANLFGIENTQSCRFRLFRPGPSISDYRHGLMGALRSRALDKRHVLVCRTAQHVHALESILESACFSQQPICETTR